MSAKASSPVGFCVGSALPAGTGVGAPAGTPPRSSELMADRPRSTRMPPANANRATMTSAGDPNRRPSRDGDAGETEASGATGMTTSVGSPRLVEASPGVDAEGGVLSGSAGTDSVGSGGGRGIVGSPGRSWAGTARTRTPRTRDHRSIFADEHEGEVAAE